MLLFTGVASVPYCFRLRPDSSSTLAAGAVSWSGCCRPSALTRGHRHQSRAGGNRPRGRRCPVRTVLAADPTHYATIAATDVLEHVTKLEVLQVSDDTAAALAPGGVFVGRIPNAISPLGAHIRNGDFTHQTSFTVRSIRQLIAAAGFDSVLARCSPPVAQALARAARVAVGQVASACSRIAPAAGTGMPRGHIVTQNLTFAACKDAEPVSPSERNPA